jgi:hypothetical protein
MFYSGDSEGVVVLSSEWLLSHAVANWSWPAFELLGGSVPLCQDFADSLVPSAVP